MAKPSIVITDEEDVSPKIQQKGGKQSTKSKPVEKIASNSTKLLNKLPMKTKLKFSPRDHVNKTNEVSTQPVTGLISAKSIITSPRNLDSAAPAKIAQITSKIPKAAMKLNSPGHKRV